MYQMLKPDGLSLLEQKLPVTHIVTMAQKEVAERMTAKPGGKNYGALSVAVQYYCSVTKITEENVFITVRVG